MNISTASVANVILSKDLINIFKAQFSENEEGWMEVMNGKCSNCDEQNIPIGTYYIHVAEHGKVESFLFC